MAKPNMPMAGATMELSVTMSTSRKPIIGPVQEKLTSASVAAMKKMLMSPLVAEARSSIFVLHDDGSERSKPPKKEAAKTTSSAHKKRLKMALVERAFSDEGPQMSVTSSPSPT